MARALPRARLLRPCVEPLEDRCLLTTYTVTTTRDLLHDSSAGEVTLRDVLAAIATQAPSGNAAAGTASNTVRFALPGTGPQTITSTAALPALTHPAFLDGWSQGGVGYGGPPLVVLDGSGAGPGADGLEFDAGSDGSQVRGLVIQRFGGNGIEIKGASGLRITANDIGTDAGGTAAVGNLGDGVLLDGGAAHNTVGPGNVLSANGNGGLLTGAGVEITGAGTSGNVVLGNLIGTDRTGTAALGNVHAGVAITGGAAGNTVGGTAAGAANVICGSLETVPGPVGVRQAAVFWLGAPTITGSVAAFDVQVNYADAPSSELVYLGLDVAASGAALEPTNPDTGQADFSAFHFTPSAALGPAWAPVSNVPPGEFVYHVTPSDGLRPGATYLVGTLTYDLSRFGITPDPSLVVSLAGSAARADTVIGTEVFGDPSTFGFVTPTFAPGERPLQAVPGTAGVDIRDGGTSGNAVLSNLIGTDRGGTARLGHLSDGVWVHTGAAQNTVGGNVLAGSDSGVALTDAGTSGNLVLGNRLGTDWGGRAKLGNTLAGVFLAGGAASNGVGGTAAGTGNAIAFNGKGVVVGSSAADVGTVHDSVLGNRIYGNAGLGIDLGNQGVAANGANPRAFPNDGQNAPVITALTLHSISGRLTSVPNASYRVELFATPVGTAAGQAQLFLGAVTVALGPSGSAAFTAPVALPPGAVVTATATNLANGDTSAVSPAGTQLLVLSNPVITSGGAPQVVTVTAQLFSESQPVTSGPVKLTVVGLPVQVTATPNANGVVTFRFTVPAGVRPGTYSLLVTFPGTEGVPGATGAGLLTALPGALAAPSRAGRRWAR